MTHSIIQFIVITCKTAIENIIYDGRWTGSAAGAPYASLGRSFDFRFLDARAGGNDSLLGATLVHLENLYLPAASSFTDLQVSGLKLFYGPQDLEVSLDRFSLPASSQGDVWFGRPGPCAEQFDTTDASALSLTAIPCRIHRISSDLRS